MNKLLDKLKGTKMLGFIRIAAYIILFSTSSAGVVGFLEMFEKYQEYENCLSDLDKVKQQKY